MTEHSTGVLGWDVGGVNTKVARVHGGRVLAVHGRPYEVQRAPEAMTAELSQMFRLKREGVAFVLAAMHAAFPDSTVRVFTVRGGFVSIDDAAADPLLVAAANWAATAQMVAAYHPDAILVDIGTTSTDVIPIVGGRVVARGLTDPARLSSGELLYTGALRSPVEATLRHVPYRGELAGVSAEGFALMGDVHLWRGDLAPEDYSVPAPDGRPPTREFAGERLARVVCADRELIDDAGIGAIADAAADAQRRHVVAVIRRVLDRHPQLRTAVVTGLGAFIAAAAAAEAGLEVVALESTFAPLGDGSSGTTSGASLGAASARCAPAAAVALLLDGEEGIA